MKRKINNAPASQTKRSAFPGWRFDAQHLENRWVLFLVSLLLTLLMVYHYVVPLNALFFTVGNEGQDCGQMVWNLWSVTESLSRLQNPYWTNRIFYPVGANLSRHSLAAGFFPVTLLVKLFSGGDVMYPFYAYRIIVLLSFTLILYTSYLLLRQLGFSPWASIIPALGYGFCDFYMLHALYLNHMAGFFIPLVALFLVQLYQKPTTLRALLAGLTAAAAIYFTEFALYIYMGLGCLLLALCLFAGGRKRLKGKLQALGLKRILLATAVFLFIIAPYLYLFFKAQDLRPSPAEASLYSANLAAFLIPTAAKTPLYGNLFSSLDAGMIGIGGYEIFVGFPFFILGLLGLFKAADRRARTAALIALFFFMLSLGPTLKVLRMETGFPLPYALLARVPPFDVGRTPVRFVVMAMFFWMIAAAAGINWTRDALARRVGRRWSTAASALLLLWVVAEAYSPIPRQKPFAPPQGLDQIVKGPVLNLPLVRADGYAAMLQIFHHQPIATGFVARVSQEQLRHLGGLDRLLGEGGQRFCEGLLAMGFRNIIIEPQSVAPGAQEGLLPLELWKCPVNVVDLRREEAAAPEQGQSLRLDETEQPARFPSLTSEMLIDLRQPEADQYLWYGWSVREPSYRWTRARRAAIVFSLDQREARTLEVRMGAFIVAGKHEQQRVEVRLNGQSLTTWTLKRPGPKAYRVDVPVELLREKNVLDFGLPDAESPASYGLSDDDRLLGVYVESVALRVKS